MDRTTPTPWLDAIAALPRQDRDDPRPLFWVLAAQRRLPPLSGSGRGR